MSGHKSEIKDKKDDLSREVEEIKQRWDVMFPLHDLPGIMTAQRDILTLLARLRRVEGETYDPETMKRSGVDVHGGLRVRLEYDKTLRTIKARWSAESGVDVDSDVGAMRTRLQQTLSYLDAWANERRKELERQADDRAHDAEGRG